MAGVGGAAIPCRSHPQRQPHRFPPALPRHRGAGPGGDRSPCAGDRRQPAARGPRHSATGVRGAAPLCWRLPHRARRRHGVAPEPTQVPSHPTQDRGSPELRAQRVPPVRGPGRPAARLGAPEGDPPHLPPWHGHPTRREGRPAKLPKPHDAGLRAPADAQYGVKPLQCLHARHAGDRLGDGELADVWRFLRGAAPILRAG
jgi:hypothetical protein